MKKRANPKAIKSLQGLNESRAKRKRMAIEIPVREPVAPITWSISWDETTIWESFSRVFYSSGITDLVGCDDVSEPPEGVISPEETLAAAERWESIDDIIPLGVDEIRWSEYNRKFNELLRRPKREE